MRRASRIAERVLFGLICLLAFGFLGILLLYLGLFFFSGMRALLKEQVNIWLFVWDGAQVGIIQMFMGTFWTAFPAVLAALPLSLGCALFVTEWPNRLSAMLERFLFACERIPSVLVGLFGLAVIVPWLQQATDYSVGRSGIAACLVLMILALPFITNRLVTAIRGVSEYSRLNSYGLGASTMQTIRRVVLPAIKKDVLLSWIMAFLRAIGEMAAVFLVVGNVPYFRQGAGALFSSMRTVSTHLFIEQGVAQTEGTAYNALLIMALLMMIVSFGLYWMIRRLSGKAVSG